MPDEITHHDAHDEDPHQQLTCTSGFETASRMNVISATPVTP